MSWQRTVWLIVAIFVLAVLLFGVFPGKIILPQTFAISSWQVHYYGLIIALAILLAWRFLKNRIDRVGITASQLENLFIVVLVSGFIGARIYHVLSSLDFYLENPTQIFMVWNGGLGIFGALIGGLIGLYFYNKFHLQIQFGKLLDFLVPGVVIGQIIGRFGNLFNYEAYGLPTNLPWKMFVPEGFRLFGYETNAFFNPLFLYESLAGLLILWVLLRYNDFAKKFGLPERSGNKFWLWLILYGIVRFGLEFLRIDSNLLFGIKQTFLVSGLMIIIGLAGMLSSKQYAQTAQS